jgi:hypothetical protein
MMAVALGVLLARARSAAKGVIKSTELVSVGTNTWTAQAPLSDRQTIFLSCHTALRLRETEHQAK